jgi:phosphate transport system substrate-binding protein
MRNIFVTFLAALTLSSGAVAQVTGAGATFPAPLYSKWAESYNKSTGITINYQSVGSGAGIRQITAKTVDFGATDDPMSTDDLKKHGLYQFPTAIGGVVPVVNLRGIEAGKMTLDGTTLAAIFSGKITKWTDPAITRLNPGLRIPDTAITLAYRSDSSGTTAVFTDYLSGISAEFKASPGAGKTVNWPSGVGGRGNAGVAATVAKIDGAIGYVEYAFVKQNKMAYIALFNKNGRVIHPDDTTFAESARGANWNVPGMAVNLNNGEGWPITSPTFVLIYETADKSKDVVRFFDWAFTNGGAAAIDLDYVPLPEKVQAAIRAEWRKLKLQ